jgi:hypothetical protein
MDLQGSQLQAPVRVAVAFSNDPGNELQIVDTRTEGRFPSGFTAALTQPPPSPALQQLYDGEPELAYGYLTAVERDHPPSIRIANERSGGGGCTQSECTEEESWCSEGEDAAQDLCYEEHTTCDVNHQNCTVSASGDLTLKTGPWQTIAGVATSYLVLYLSRPAAAGSFTALAFAEGSALSAGYHLLAATPRTQAEQDAASACVERSQELALERYNHEHGTQLDDPSALPAQAEDEFDQLFFSAQLELACPQTAARYTPISNTEVLSIQLSRGEDAFSL